MSDWEKFDHFKVKEPYYNGYRLLSMLDRNKEKPEIFISTTNRSAGKTTFFNGLRVHKFLENGEKTLLLFRHKYEAENCATAFFASVQNVFYPELEMVQETGLKNVFYNLYLKEKNDDSDTPILKHFGYATSLSARNQIKKYSNMMSDVSCILFDEFQPEDGRYLKDETSALISIHDSVARGGGSQCRYLPLIMIGNLIDINNPYYEKLGCLYDMDIKCKFYKGEGFVIEQGFNEESASKHKQSAFHKAFKNDSYINASQEKEYINTDYTMLLKVNDLNGYYICTIRHLDTLYSVRYLNDIGMYYVSRNPDTSHNIGFACSKDDISERYIFDKSNNYVRRLKVQFYKGNVRFDTFKSREAFLEFIK